MYKAKFDKKWSKYFSKLDEQTKERTMKKIKKILNYPKKRHLEKGAEYFVDEIGQYRVLYMVFEESQEVRFYFAGNHKEYKKWYKQFF